MTRLLEHTEGRIAAAIAQIWPRAETTLGPTVTGGSAVRRQVRVDDHAPCATASPAGTALSSVGRGDHGDLAAVLSGADAPGQTQIVDPFVRSAYRRSEHS
ncbi:MULTISPECIES: hypothetical protein [unclassified Frankia]|uniref:hypothetical protein n=1 Tax=unclassified Frankia TaxID=2632575 RepID=UPI002AD2E973|nr:MULTISPECIES: hypothetical protein [unclassified Frankia]